MPPELSARYTDDLSQRRWLLGLGFSLRPGDVALSLPLGDAWRAWRLYAHPPGLRWTIARSAPDACCELPRTPLTLEDILSLCREVGAPVNRRFG